jgi:hypothetical protein
MFSIQLFTLAAADTKGRLPRKRHCRRVGPAHRLSVSFVDILDLHRLQTLRSNIVRPRGLLRGPEHVQRAPLCRVLREASGWLACWWPVFCCPLRTIVCLLPGDLDNGVQNVGLRPRNTGYVHQAQHRGLPTLVVARFSLIFWCTRRAHNAFELVEKTELSFQSIMGATEKRWILVLSLFISRAYRQFATLI